MREKAGKPLGQGRGAGASGAPLKKHPYTGIVSISYVITKWAAIQRNLQGVHVCSHLWRGGFLDKPTPESNQIPGYGFGEGACRRRRRESGQTRRARRTAAAAWTGIVGRAAPRPSGYSGSGLAGGIGRLKTVLRLSKSPEGVRRVAAFRRGFIPAPLATPAEPDRPVWAVAPSKNRVFDGRGRRPCQRISPTRGNTKNSVLTGRGVGAAPK